MQKILTAITLLAFTFTSAQAYRMETSERELNLNSGNSYSRAFELIYVPEEGEDLSKIPSQIRVQLRAEGLGSNFVNLHPGDTIVKLPQGDELRNEFPLRQYFNVNANAAGIIASGISTLIPLPVNISNRFSLYNSDPENFDLPREAEPIRAEISLFDFDDFVEPETSEEDTNTFKTMKLESIKTSTLVYPILKVDQEDSSKYSIGDLPQPRVHMEAAVPTGVNPQITDAVTQALIKKDLENTTFAITKNSSSKLKNFFSRFKQKKFTLSDVNAIILDSSDENTKRISIDGLVNEADDLSLRAKGLRIFLDKAQANSALNGDKLDAESLDTNQSKKAKLSFKAKTNGKEKGLFHNAKGKLDVIFAFDNLEAAE